MVESQTGPPRPRLPRPRRPDPPSHPARGHHVPARCRRTRKTLPHFARPPSSRPPGARARGSSSTSNAAAAGGSSLQRESPQGSARSWLTSSERSRRSVSTPSRPSLEQAEQPPKKPTEPMPTLEATPARRATHTAQPQTRSPSHRRPPPRVFDALDPPRDHPPVVRPCRHGHPSVETEPVSGGAYSILMQGTGSPARPSERRATVRGAYTAVSPYDLSPVHLGDRLVPGGSSSSPFTSARSKAAPNSGCCRRNSSPPSLATVTTAVERCPRQAHHAPRCVIGSVSSPTRAPLHALKSGDHLDRLDRNQHVHRRRPPHRRIYAAMYT